MPASGEKMRHVSPLSCAGRNIPQQRWGFISPVVYLKEYQSNSSFKKSEVEFDMKVVLDRAINAVEMFRCVVLG